MATMNVHCEKRGLRAAVQVITSGERTDGGGDLVMLRLGDGQVEVTFFVTDEQLKHLNVKVADYLCSRTVSVS